MNLSTYMLSLLEPEKTKRYEEIVALVDSMLRDIDELMEDPLFINNIHGEQELSLDQTVDLFTGIRSQFVPLLEEPKVSPAHEAGIVDVS